MCVPPSKWALDLLHVHMIMSKTNSSPLTSSFDGSVLLAVILKKSKLLSSFIFCQQNHYQIISMDASDNNIS